MTWRLFIDDERYPAAHDYDFVVARSLADVRVFLKLYGAPSFISFDHDLGEGQPTGLDIAKMLVELDMDGDISIDPLSFDFYVHSQNPVGKTNIEFYLRGYLAMLREY